MTGISGRPLLAVALALALAACQTAGGAVAPTPTPVVSQAASPPQVKAVAYTETAPASAASYSEYVLDMATGSELYAHDADKTRYPASLTKMMTLYLLFDEVGSGRYSLSSPLTVSARAASQPPAKLGLKPGSTITVEQAARALAVKSANDVAVAIAENISGSEDAFAAKMNAQARALGLTRTHFANASGLPDPNHVSTARDMARLGRALKTRFPPVCRVFPGEVFHLQRPDLQDDQQPAWKGARRRRTEDGAYQRGGLQSGGDGAPGWRTTSRRGHGQQERRRPRQGSYPPA